MRFWSLAVCLFLSSAAFSQVNQRMNVLSVDPTIDRSVLVQDLQSKFNVTIVEDNPTLFDRDFLVYLYAYFSTAKVDAPIYLYATSETGAERVWLRTPQILPATYPGKYIYFAKNAGDGLVSKKLSEAQASMNQHPELVAKADKIQITIDYSNTLFEQLSGLLFDQQSLEEVIRVRFGIDTKCDVNSDETCVSFSAQELLTILKQFEDLPSYITNNFHLI